MTAYNFAICKACGERSGEPRFKLKHDTTIFVCSACGFHYINALDDSRARREWPEDTIDIETRNRALEIELDSNTERLMEQIRLSECLANLKDARCLDIGAGTGSYLDRLRRSGADVCGIEPCVDMRRCAKDRFNLDLRSAFAEEIENVFPEDDCFDLITLWDVVEHLNFPHRAIAAAAARLRPGGHLVVATPIRDTLYYESSRFLYRISRGRYSGWLDMLYSSSPYAHKQIFHSDELAQCGHTLGLKLVLRKRVRELAAPSSYYVDQVVPPGSILRPAAPVVSSLIQTLQLPNKIWMAWKRPAHA